MDRPNVKNYGSVSKGVSIFDATKDLLKMTREDQLKFCSVCTNRGFNPKHGIICGLTNAMATFTESCTDYVKDEKEIQLEEQRKDSLKGETNKEINRGRYALFIVGILYVITGFVESFVIDGHDILYGIIDWIVAAIFIGFGVLSYKKASLALILGLSFYVLIVILLALVDPTTLLKGVLWKILIVVSLVYGLRTSLEEDAKKKKTVMDNGDLLDQSV